MLSLAMLALMLLPAKLTMLMMLPLALQHL
jgi:hypothetical protein